MLSLIRYLALTLLAALVLPAAAQQPIWHFSPYQIRVWTALAPAAELNAALEQDLLRTLRERAEATALAPWTVTPEPAPASMRGTLLAGLEWVTVEQLAPNEKSQQPPSTAESAPSTAALSAGASSTSSGVPAEAVPPLNGGEASPASPPPDFTNLLESHDKLFLVRVAPQGGGFAVEARELDCRTRQWSEVVSRRAGHASLIPVEAFRAVQEAFRPLARIERAKAKEATVRLRAGGLITGDQSPAFWSEDVALTPVVRMNDRRGLPRVGGIQTVPWAFLTLKERLPHGRVECELVAGAATGLTGRSSRIEKYALAAPSRHEKTDLIVRARPLRPNDPEPTPPLAGYEVHERLPGAKELTLVGRTDWRGLIEIAKTDRPVRVLYVKNGARVLAKVPVAPGLYRRLEVNVMNDDRRLEVEGFCSGMQSRIMDLVVAREVYALLIRRGIREGKFDEAQSLMAELRALPSRDQVAAELDQEAARQRVLPADRVTKAAIDKLFTDTRALITKYLDPNLIVNLERELRQARPSG